MQTKEKVAAISLLALLLAMPLSTFATTTTPKPGASFVNWNLSGAVMPVPPYGSQDKIGSDTASKLIINQPNGLVNAMLTGSMNGLYPSSTYTVYLANGYTPYVPASVTGEYEILFCWTPATWNGMTTGCNPYNYDVTLSQTGTAITGTGLYPAGMTPTYGWTLTGSITGINAFSFTATYNLGAPGTVMQVIGTVASNGMLSGTWSDNYGGTRTGTWYSTSGIATPASGSTGYPGLATDILPFTFTTDAYGVGSWHINLYSADFTSGPSTYTLSVWINYNGATILISDPFTFTIS